MATTTTDQGSGPVAPGRLPAYRPPKGQRTREVLRGTGSVLAVLVIVVGVPVGLLLALGSPLPSSVPSRDVLTQPLDAVALLRVLSFVVWLAWAHFVVCLIVEWRSERRGVGLPTHVLLGGGSQAVARRLVAAILLLAGTSVLAAPFVASGPPAPRPAATSTARPAADDAVGAQAVRAAHTLAREEFARPVADAGVTVFYDVEPPEGRHHDSLWDIAHRYLGDGRRYKEIFALNEGRDQPDGRRLEQPRLIRPGWVLQMPTDARGPGLRVVAPPAVPAAPADPASQAPAAGSSSSTSAAAHATAPDVAATTGAHDDGSLPWRGVVGGSLLAAGLLASLRRTRGSAPVGPDATGVEADLRLAADQVGSAFLDRALRGLAHLRAEAGAPAPEVYAAALGTDALVLSLAPARDDAPAPWTSSPDGRTWTVTRADADALDVPDDVLAPYPGLACFGEQDSWRMLLDLESAPGILSVGGVDTTARALAASVAVELATNAWSDTVRVTLVGFGDALDGLAPGRLRHADDLDDVLAEIEARVARQAGARADDAVLRGRAQRTDRAAWAPDFLVLSGAPHPEQLERINALTGDTRNACGVLTVGDVVGARWRFVVSADGRLNTGPLGLMLDAQLLPVDDYRRLAPLFATAARARGAASLTPTADVTLLEHRELPAPPADAEPEERPTPPAAARPGRPVPARHLDLAAHLPVEIRLLGPVAVEAPGPLDAERRDLATELAALLALHPAGVHPNVVSSALWPRGAEPSVRDALLAHLQGWLGRDSAGRARLRQDTDGRWVLDQDVRCDWQVFRALAARAAGAGPAEAAALQEQALTLLRGPAFESLPSGRYTWLAHTGTEAGVRRLVVGTAHALATHRQQAGDGARAEAAARAGLRLLPESEVLWRDVLLAAASSGDREQVAAVAAELYDTLEARRVARPEAQTDALVDELLPGFRRRVA